MRYTVQPGIMRLELRPCPENGGPWGDWFDPKTGKDVLRAHRGRLVAEPLLVDVNFRGKAATYAPAVNQILALFRYTMRPLFRYRMVGCTDGRSRRRYFAGGTILDIPTGDEWFRVNATDWRYLPGTVTIPMVAE